MYKNTSPAERTVYLIKRVGLIVGILLIYYLFNKITNLGIPCIFNTLTGYHCVGCGISRMFIALFDLDFKAASNANIYVLCLLPIALFVFTFKAYRFIKYGITSDPIWLNIIYIVLLICGIIFGILRNLPSFGFLAPH